MGIAVASTLTRDCFQKKFLKNDEMFSKISIIVVLLKYAIWLQVEMSK